jgi:FdhE protein
MVTPWVSHRRRAEFLRESRPFAAELLGVYLGLLDVWEGAAEPPVDGLAGWAAEQVLPDVVRVAEECGPEPLGKAARELFDAGGLDEALAGWLAGAGLPPVERFLARASLYAPLVALGEAAGEACVVDPEARDDRHCPRCGGPPQLSFRGDAREQLVSGRRFLLCARCGHSWGYSQSSCPSCGETTGSRRTVYAEQRTKAVVGRPSTADYRAEGAAPEGANSASANSGSANSASANSGSANSGSTDAPTFPHLRIDACSSCQRYLIDVDLGCDGRAVPEVDEIAALPIDLYAVERGLSKITPNLMGF